MRAGKIKDHVLKNLPSNVSCCCRGFGVECLGADKKSSPHYSSLETVLTSLWSAGSGSELAGGTDLVKLNFIMISCTWSGSLSTAKMHCRGRQSRDYDLSRGLSYHCVGKPEGFEHRAVFRSKGSCITSGKNHFGCVSPPAGQDGKSGSEAGQSRQASSRDSFTKVIDFSVGPQGLISLVEIGTTIFLSPV